MALMSRFGFLSSQKFGNILVSSVARFSFCRFNNKVLSRLESAQTFSFFRPQISGSLCLQRNQSNNGDSKQNVKKGSVNVEAAAGSNLSQKARLKQAVRDYGATVIVFHVAISLASLGICYAAISAGVDAVSLLSRYGFPDYVISSKIAVGGSTFVIAYAVHKLFAPLRIFITLSSSPFIVRYLRKINLLKPPK